MPTRFQFRRANAAAWTTSNPILAAGELGYELDTNKFKIGDGVSDWSTLAYSNAPSNFVDSLPSIEINTLSLKTKDTQSSDGPNTAAYGNGTYVVGFFQGYIYYSTDGETWTEATSSPFRSVNNNYGNQAIYDLVFANGIFIAVGDAGLIASSPDGITWTQRSAWDDVSNTISTNESNPINYTLNSVAYGDGKFVACSWSTGGIIMTSSDGLSWTQTTYEGVYHEHSVYYSGVAFGDGYFVLAGEFTDPIDSVTKGLIAYASSSNLASWSITVINEVSPWVIHFANGKFIVGGGSFVPATNWPPIAYASSTNLASWSLASAPTLEPAFDSNVVIGYDYYGGRGLTYVNGIWFAAVKSYGGYWSSENITTPYPLIYSDNEGVTWQPVSNLSFTIDSDDMYNGTVIVTGFGDKVFASNWSATAYWAYLSDLTTWYEIVNSSLSSWGIFINKVVNGRLLLGTYNNDTLDGEIYLTNSIGIYLGYDSASPTGVGWIIGATGGGGGGINGATAPVTYDLATKTVALDYGTGLTTSSGALVPDFGSTTGKVAQGDDSRFTDSRTPTAHKTSHSTGGTDALAPSDIGAVPTSRSLTGTAPVTIGGVSGSGQDLSTDRTIAVTAASTSAAGVVQLSDSTSTTSSVLAATPTAVKSAYDLASAALPKTSPAIVATFAKASTLAVGSGTFRWYNDSGSTLTIGTVRASVGTAPTGASLILDVNVSGTTIYSTQANRPTIAASGVTTTGGSKSTTTITNGQYITIDIDQVGSTIAGADLVVQIWLSYA